MSIEIRLGGTYAAVLDARERDGEAVLSFVGPPAEAAWWYWCGFLYMCLRDRASSLHFHPWHGSLRVAYISDGVRYGLIPPSDDYTREMILAWRRRLAPGPWGRLVRLFFPARTLAGELRTVLHGKATEWAVVCWSVGNTEGVDIYRRSPLPTPDPEWSVSDISTD